MREEGKGKKEGYNSTDWDDLSDKMGRKWRVAEEDELSALEKNKVGLGDESEHEKLPTPSPLQKRCKVKRNMGFFSKLSGDEINTL